MNFTQMRKYLYDIFETNNYIERVKNNEVNSVKILLYRCVNGSEVWLIFPGYKRSISTHTQTYDYRIDLIKDGKPLTLSHTNIIVDIYNKIINGGMDSFKLREELISLARTGEYDLNNITNNLPYNPCPPPQDLLNRALTAHDAKKYNSTYNLSDLTLEELFNSIKWIALQEDINYPIQNGREGRRMSFARYMETIYITQINYKSFENVVSRSLLHLIPTKWDCVNYDYEILIV